MAQTIVDNGLALYNRPRSELSQSPDIVLVFVIGAVFWWAVSSGQFDDLEGPAHRILMDDDRPRE